MNGYGAAMRGALAYPLARTAGYLSRRLGRGGGTSLPGKVLLRAHPTAVAHLGRRLNGGAVCVSATNGKTTTCRLLAACLASDDVEVVSNPAGANLLTGVATALLDGTGGRRRDRRGLFEVDEAALPEVVRQLRPGVLVLMNLFRDQLDRYGELEAVAGRWRTMVDALPAGTHLVLNGDDPAVAELGAGRDATYFGVDSPALGTDTAPHASDSTRCRRCGHLLTYRYVTLGHMGDWACDACGAARPALDVAVTAAEMDGTRGQHIRWRTPQGDADTVTTLPGLHNAYNATAALAAALRLGVPVGRAATALSGAGAAFGRAERVALAGRDLVLLLAKNPAGANTTVQTMLLDAGPLHVLVALNDRTADGQDVSWIWDVDYEPLVARIETLTVTGDRAYDMALRFAYAGVDRARIAVAPEPADALDRAVAGVPDGGTLYVLPTYTAMLRLREILVERGAATEFWRDR